MDVLGKSCRKMKRLFVSWAFLGSEFTLISRGPILRRLKASVNEENNNYQGKEEDFAETCDPKLSAPPRPHEPGGEARSLLYRVVTPT